MKKKNNLTLAVAGSGKTQGIVDACCSLGDRERVLVVTYTTLNQGQLRTRISAGAGMCGNVEVMGWFSFLIAHFVRPFLPFIYQGKRVRGFDFESQPQLYRKNDDYAKYFNAEGQARGVHLAQLATRVEEASDQAPTKRLARIYDRIHIDEVQDLSEYDLEVLAMLMDSVIPVDMVGDVRQAVLATNARGRKNKSFMYMGIWNWFRKAERAGRLAITQQTQTWRCRPEIAKFADALFDASCGFDPTVSLNTTVTGHDGLFLVRRADVPAYLADFDPLLLRYSKGSARSEPYAFMNYRASKGLTCDRVLVWPTAAVGKLIAQGAPLAASTVCALYVAVTRARQSVAFVMDQAGNSEIPFWSSGD